MRRVLPALILVSMLSACQAEQATTSSDPTQLTQAQVDAMSLSEARYKLQEIAEARKQHQGNPEVSTRLQNEFKMLMTHIRTMRVEQGDPPPRRLPPPPPPSYAGSPLTQAQIDAMSLSESRVMVQLIADERLVTTNPEESERLRNEFKMLMVHMRELQKNEGSP